MNSKALSSEGVKNGDFSNAFEPSEMSTGDIEQTSGEKLPQSPVGQRRTDSLLVNDSNSIDQPSLEQMSAATNPSVTEQVTSHHQGICLLSQSTVYYNTTFK